MNYQERKAAVRGNAKPLKLFLSWADRDWPEWLPKLDAADPTLNSFVQSAGPTDRSIAAYQTLAKKIACNSTSAGFIPATNVLTTEIGLNDCINANV